MKHNAILHTSLRLYYVSSCGSTNIVLISWNKNKIAAFHLGSPLNYVEFEMKNWGDNLFGIDYRHSYPAVFDEAQNIVPLVDHLFLFLLTEFHSQIVFWNAYFLFLDYYIFYLHCTSMMTNSNVTENEGILNNNHQSSLLIVSLCRHHVLRCQISMNFGLIAFGTIKNQNRKIGKTCNFGFCYVFATFSNC